MATTVIDTTAIPRIKGSNGSSAEILNRELCGATYSRGALRWLQDGERFDARSDVPAHQLIYFLDGKGAIKLDSKEYEVEKGGGRLFGAFRNGEYHPSWFCAPQSISSDRAKKLKLKH
jgi:hypothetical protein